MKRVILFILIIGAAGILATGQTTDPLVSKCVMDAGPNARYLKDFRVQLGKAPSSGELRYKAQMSLWKNTKYRFSLCNSEDSKGQLILNLKDDTNKQVLTSYDPKTGKPYPFVEFVCNKSGIYQLNFDFLNGEAGSGVGVVSMVK